MNELREILKLIDIPFSRLSTKITLINKLIEKNLIKPETIEHLTTTNLAEEVHVLRNKLKEMRRRLDKEEYEMRMKLIDEKDEMKKRLIEEEYKLKKRLIEEEYGL
jgi:hypothetical protein